MTQKTPKTLTVEYLLQQAHYYHDLVVKDPHHDNAPHFAAQAVELTDQARILQQQLLEHEHQRFMATDLYQKALDVLQKHGEIRSKTSRPAGEVASAKTKQLEERHGDQA